MTVINHERYPEGYGDNRDLIQRVFGKNPEPGLAMKIKREAPALYDALRNKAREANIVGETNQERNRLAGVREPDAPKLLDADEQLARSQFSEAEIDRIIAHQGAIRDEKGQLTANPDNLVAMKKSEPMKRYYFDLAMYSYGKSSNRPIKPQAETKVSTQPDTFELAPNLCTKFNVAPGTHVTLEQFTDLSVKHHAEEKARIAAAAAVTEQSSQAGAAQ
jgi:hypothetical protein